jgi:hypothetical protein
MRILERVIGLSNCDEENEPSSGDGLRNQEQEIVKREIAMDLIGRMLGNATDDVKCCHRIMRMDRRQKRKRPETGVQGGGMTEKEP